MQEASILNSQYLRSRSSNLNFRLQYMARDWWVSRSPHNTLWDIPRLIYFVLVDILLLERASTFLTSFTHNTHIYFGDNSGGRSRCYFSFHLLFLFLFFFFLSS